MFTTHFTLTYHFILNIMSYLFGNMTNFNTFDIKYTAFAMCNVTHCIMCTFSAKYSDFYCRSCSNQSLPGFYTKHDNKSVPAFWRNVLPSSTGLLNCTHQLPSTYGNIFIILHAVITQKAIIYPSSLLLLLKSRKKVDIISTNTVHVVFFISVAHKLTTQHFINLVH
jgi:hypothetical protein